MKRTFLSLEMIAEYKNLQLALYKAAKGKRHRKSVQAFLREGDEALAKLGNDIRKGKLPYGRYKVFEIYDPKHRQIHAACFEDRIFHHALMNLAGPALEKSMTFHSYACRKDKGVHKAVQHVQRNLQRYRWFVKIDIDGYFASIEHERLLRLLENCFKGEEINSQFLRVLKRCPVHQDKGLPIGSLTSQYFANYFLDGLDRLLENDQEVRANLRYMDDVLWWCDSKAQAKQTLQAVKVYLRFERGLIIKPSIQILPSKAGVSYCGFRITQGNLRMSRRRKRNFTNRRLYWEQQYLSGQIDALQLQNASAAVHAISHGTNSLAWRQQQLKKYPAIDV